MSDTTPVIALIGAFAGHHRLIIQLARWGYETVHVSAPDRLVDCLLDRYPALILVDGRDPGWESWVAVIKTEQALRRLRVLIVTPDDSASAHVRSTGADGILRSDIAEVEMKQRIAEHIRRLEPEIAARLARQCRETLPPLARLGVERFNAGAYYAQHDAFEAQWMAEPGPVRDLYRAILQVGVAYYHITRGNYAGGLKMLRRCVQWFAVLPDECQGIDVKQLRDDAAQVRAVLPTLEAQQDRSSVDPALFKPIRLLDSP